VGLGCLVAGILGANPASGMHVFPSEVGVPFFNYHVHHGYGHQISFILSLCIYLFIVSFIHIQKQQKHSWLLNML
jgi:hypothetical protein